MTMTMIQADRNFASPSDDASLYSGLIGDRNGLLNRDNKMMISTSGLVATIGTGQAIIQGRLIKITAPEQLTLPANSSGSICLVVDLTQTNTVSGTAGEADYGVDVNQVYLAVMTGALTQDDLNNGGFIYDFPLASFTTTSSTISIGSQASLLNDTGRITIPTMNGNAQSTTWYDVIGNTVFAGSGQIQRVHQGQTIFQIPAPYTPPFQHNQPVALRLEGSGVGASVLGILELDTDGSVVLSLTPSNSTSPLYDIWPFVHYPLI